MSGFPNLQPQTIAVVSAGAIEYTRSLTYTALDGQNISTSTLLLNLGGEDAPNGSFVACAVSAASSISVKAWRKLGGSNPFDLADSQMLYQQSGALLVGTTLAPVAGSYWLWAQLADNPEVIPRRGFKVIVT